MLTVTIENGSEKYVGVIPKINEVGFFVELEKILFSVGSFLTVHIDFGEGRIGTERVRSIKHYDNYFSTPPKKNMSPNVKQPEPKRLVEFHFQGLTEPTRRLMSQYQLNEKVRRQNSGRNS